MKHKANVHHKLGVTAICLLTVLFLSCSEDNPAPENPNGPEQSHWPNASNTGVPEGVQLTPSDGFTITEDGTVIEKLDISGVLNIAASNVTVKYCKIKGGIFFRSYLGHENLLIEDCEIGPSEGSGGDNGVVFSHYTMRRCNIHNFYDGAKINGNVLIEDCYIHDMYLDNGAHIDGLQNVGGQGDVTLRHNNIDVRPYNVNNDNGNAAIFFADFPEGTMTIENNLLAGGHYTLQVLDNAEYIVRNNHFVRDSYTYGTHRYTCESCISIWEGNVFANDGEEISF